MQTDASKLQAKYNNELQIERLHQAPLPFSSSKMQIKYRIQIQKKAHRQERKESRRKIQNAGKQKNRMPQARRRTAGRQKAGDTAADRTQQTPDILSGRE